MWPFRHRSDKDFASEIDAHVAIETDRLIAEGVPAEQAGFEARRRFGNVMSARERFYESRHPTWLVDARRDLRYAVRSLIMNRRFSIAAVFTLALGIGGSVAMFAAIDTLFLRELPYRDADRVALVWQTTPGNSADRLGVAPGVFFEWRERAAAFAAMAAMSPASFDYLSGPEPLTLDAAVVSPGFFDVLGVKPALGRPFRPDDHAAGRSDIVLLSDGAWRRVFGGDPGVVGRTITLEGRPFTVIGVLPSWMRPERLELDSVRSLDVWSPGVPAANAVANFRDRFWTVIVRPHEEVSLSQAQAALSAISAQLALERSEPIAATVEPFRTHLVGRIRTPAVVLGGAVACVLLIACANVANLLLARGAHRRRELAIRAAIGASRGRLARQLATESAVIAGAATAIGLVLARWGMDALSALTPAYIPQLESLSLDARVCAFAAGIALLSTLLFGIWPALFWSRALPMTAASDSRSYGPFDGTHHRLASTLVVAEVAVTLMLLVAAGLLMRAIGELGRTDPGFTGSNVAVLQVFAYGERYRTDAQRVTFFERAIEGLQAVPSVESAGLVSAMPFAEANIGIRGELRLEGRELPQAGERLDTFVTIANRDYFRAMQMPLRTGRLFAEVDRGGPPVVLINELLARRHWPDADPVGDRITVSWQGKPWTAQIIGVVGALRHEGLDGDYRPELFLPFAQRPFGSMTFVVRSSTDAAALMPALEARVWAIDPTLPFYATGTLEALIADSLAPRRFLMRILATFSIVAVLLAVAGLYGVLSFVTAQRTREIGVRVALGARRADIVRTVVRQGMVLAGAGVLLGLAGALAFTRILAALLFTVSPTDPATLAGTTLLLVAVAGIACYVPAHRAMRVDPLLALKAD